MSLQPELPSVLDPQQPTVVSASEADAQTPGGSPVGQNPSVLPKVGDGTGGGLLCMLGGFSSIIGDWGFKQQRMWGPGGISLGLGSGQGHLSSLSDLGEL